MKTLKSVLSKYERRLEKMYQTNDWLFETEKYNLLVDVVNDLRVLNQNQKKGE